MQRRMFSVLTFSTLLLIGTLALALNMQTIKSNSETAYSTTALGWQLGRTELKNEWKMPEVEKQNPANVDLRRQEELRRLAWCDGDYVQLVVGVDTSESSMSTIEKVILMERGKIKGKISAGGRIQAITVEVPISCAHMFAGRLQTNGLVKYVEPNYKVQAFYVPNDLYWNQQWGPRKIRAHFAWNTTIGSSAILVAVVDTGIDYTHTDLSANYVPLGYDWFNMDDDPIDDNGHGTHCAGIIAAAINNGLGIAGLAQIQIMSEKALSQDGWGGDVEVANSIYDATDKGAKIISMSLGGPSDSSIVRDAVRYAYSHGVLLIAAAGNSASEQLHYPAAYDEVVAVSATDQSDNLASFSTYGDWIELSAPGVAVYSTFLGNSYKAMSGTSMACPHVTGVAALTWGFFAGYTRDQVRRLLRLEADDLGEMGFDNHYGYGRINAEKSLEGLPAHDLYLVTLQSPSRLDPGQPGFFNATISNYGVNNESDILVHFFVNETLIYFEVIDFLEIEASALVNFSWTTTNMGNYNITCYVVPVSGETITRNNLISVNLPVRFPATFRVPDDYQTIKTAINSVGEGDIILVLEGYYTEWQIGIYKNNITLIASGNVTLDVKNNGFGFDVKANHATIEGFLIQNVGQWYFGIEMKGYGNNIINNTVKDPFILTTREYYGIHVYDSSNCNVSLNTISYTRWEGMVFDYSSNNTISYNRLLTNYWWGGINLNYCSDNTITMNTITEWVWGGIYLTYSNNNIITSNIVRDSKVGIYLVLSQNNTLRDNVMYNNLCNFGVWYSASESPPSGYIYNDIDVSNTVDGKPIYQWVNVSDASVPLDAGYVALIDCENITVENLNLRHNIQGLQLLRTHNTRIRFNNITENRADGFTTYGICLTYSSNITINLNNITRNGVGISHGASSSCTDFLNNILDCDYGIWLSSSTMNNITSNNITSYITCMLVSYSYNNTISSNNFTGGVWERCMDMYYSTGNTFFHNNFLTETRISNVESVNIWDNGYPSGGNYWSNYTGTDLYCNPHQNETGSDGISDTPHTIDTNNTDRYPLMSPFIYEHNIGITVKIPLPIVRQGYCMDILVTISNYGVQTETFNVTAEINSTTIQRQTITLFARNSTVTKFIWNTTSLTEGNYTLTIIADTVPSETDTADNTYTRIVKIGIPGDVTGITPGVPDGRVDMRDIGALCDRFQETPADPDWDSIYDVNGDDVINMRDIGIACDNFMKT